MINDTNDLIKQVRDPAWVSSERVWRYAGNQLSIWKILEGAEIVHARHGNGSVARVTKGVYPTLAVRFDRKNVTLFSYQFHEEVRWVRLSHAGLAALLEFEQRNQLPSINRVGALPEPARIEKRRPAAQAKPAAPGRAAGQTKEWKQRKNAHRQARVGSQKSNRPGKSPNWLGHWRKFSGGKILQTSIKVVGTRRRHVSIRRRSY